MDGIGRRFCGHRLNTSRGITKGRARNGSPASCLLSRSKNGCARACKVGETLFGSLPSVRRRSRCLCAAGFSDFRRVEIRCVVILAPLRRHSCIAGFCTYVGVIGNANSTFSPIDIQTSHFMSDRLIPKHKLFHSSQSDHRRPLGLLVPPRAINSSNAGTTIYGDMRETEYKSEAVSIGDVD